MGALLIKIDSKLVELALQVDGVPEEYLVEILSPNRANEALNERMRQRHIWNGFDLVDVEDTQVGLPPAKAKQWVIV